MAKSIKIHDKLHEELKQLPGKNFTERINSLIQRGKESHPSKSKIEPPHKRYKSRGDGYLDIPEVQPEEFKDVPDKRTTPLKELNSFRMKQIWETNVSGQGGPEYPGESK